LAEIPTRLEGPGLALERIGGRFRRAIKARSRDLFGRAPPQATWLLLLCLCCPGSVPIISACGVRRREQRRTAPLLLAAAAGPGSLLDKSPVALRDLKQRGKQVVFE
jgi:hypothetical protein